MKNELTNFHAEGIENWGSEFGDKEVLQLFPPKNEGDTGSYGQISFENLANQEYQSTEFWCAMQKLDDLGVPREDSGNGEKYSIVGRIAWMTRNEVPVVEKQVH